MAIIPTNGTRQGFRFRHHDIVIRGRIDDIVPPIQAEAVLNGGRPRRFYVEEIEDCGIDWINGYKDSPSELRCKELGEFCVEIDVADPELRVGHNELALSTLDAAARRNAVGIAFTWDPRPVDLPLDLRDLTTFSHIQEVGQVLNGAFDLDREANVLRSRAPVAPDAFVILGSPHGSQEATYAVRFLEPLASKWIGLSDFMAGQEEGVPARGLKVGWSSAGMAALSPRHGARCFISWGDHSGDPREWAIATHPARPFTVETGRVYRVRHQVRFVNGINQARFRIWPAETTEPADWLCVEQDDQVPEHLPRHAAASFGLFQHLGSSVEWSDVIVATVGAGSADPVVRGSGRMPFLRRNRPGAF